MLKDEKVSFYEICIFYFSKENNFEFSYEY